MSALLVVLAVAAGLGLAFAGRAYAAWVSAGVLALGAWLVAGAQPVALFFLAGLALAGAAVLFGVPDIRRSVITPRILPQMKRMLPRLGETERVALEAGTVWWDAELFSGDPDWEKMLRFKVEELSPDERAFLEGPVEKLCEMLDDWQISQEGDLPKDVWDFIKENRFLGMIIPTEHSGLGFSALGHSAVITKISSRSVTAAVTIMVPNSLGPGELLLHYGTEEQKNYYLPRLARGEEIPCFALTGPEAGSDAAATQSQGIVERGTFDGKEVLGIRLNWRKRYITLGPIASLIGLAFRLRDPDGLLGDTEDLGITCALIPANLPGIEIGRRHDPMGIPFHNGPNQGRDVFVPIEFIIGGPEMAGQGWRMLMESLAAGRCISLPALSVGAAELATRVVGAYGTVREQFDTPIGRFEGVEEPLARIGGLTYVMNAARVITARSVDAGEKPAVLSAIIKAYLTEGMRTVVNDAMDVRAGAAIIRGPRNILARGYMALPIGITVEGANILTRSMIIYGQGAIRCHPFVQAEMNAANADDANGLDESLFRHLAHTTRMAARSFVLGLTGGLGSGSPAAAGTLLPYVRRLTRLSSAFYLVSDAAMLSLGGQLKRREKITGRLADALAWMYLGFAAVKRFLDDGEPARDRPLAEWAIQHALHQAERGLRGVVTNFPNPVLGLVLRWLVFPRGVLCHQPNDRLGTAVARSLLEDGDARRHLTQDVYVPHPDEPGLGRLEDALAHAVRALAVETKLRDALREGRLDHAPGDILADRALEAGIINSEEREALAEAESARAEAIRVDAFEPEEFSRLRH